MPAWAAPAVMGLGQLLGGMFQSEQEKADPMINRLISPEQLNLMNDEIMRFGKGQGDFGLGHFLKQAQATIGQNMQGRGIMPGSGVWQAANARAAGAGAAAAAQNRNQLGLQLMAALPGTASGQQFTNWGNGGQSSVPVVNWEGKAW